MKELSKSLFNSVSNRPVRHFLDSPQVDGHMSFGACRADKKDLGRKNMFPVRRQVEHGESDRRWRAEKGLPDVGINECGPDIFLTKMRNEKPGESTLPSACLPDQDDNSLLLLKGLKNRKPVTLGGRFP